MVNAMLWILRTGAPWRDLPERYGPWTSVHTRFLRWAKRGIWAMVMAVLNHDQDSESFMIDSAAVRVHQDATGAPKKLATKRSAGRVAARRPRSMPVSMRSETRIGSS
jgi:transposase